MVQRLRQLRRGLVLALVLQRVAHVVQLVGVLPVMVEHIAQQRARLLRGHGVRVRVGMIVRVRMRVGVRVRVAVLLRVVMVMVVRVAVFMFVVVFMFMHGDVRSLHTFLVC